MAKKKYTIGLDFGTDSVRVLIADTSYGTEVATAVACYPRWKKGLFCDPSQNLFRQHPLDYIESMEKAIKEALASAPPDTSSCIEAITADTTGSTPVAVDRRGVPLSLHPEFAENPNAMFILWKDHTAIEEANEITKLCRSWGGPDYTKYEGGIYSAEWFWAKILHVHRYDEKVREAAWSWVEHCDWITTLLAGIDDLTQLKRSRCAAGHKAMWHEEWGGLPAKEFLSILHNSLPKLRDQLFTDTYTSDEKAGELSQEWAIRLGLRPGITIGVGAFDAHLGAVGAEIKPWHLTKVMGTSTCDMMVAEEKELQGNCIKGICGQVNGSIIPGLTGIEAGQSAFGDVYAWFSDFLMWPMKNAQKSMMHDELFKNNELLLKVQKNLIEELTAEAEKTAPSEKGVWAIDWFNGRRTPDANQHLKGAIAGLSLGSTAPQVFRALVEATAFGSKSIAERLMQEGVRIEGVIALGGVAKKSRLVMQILADVLNMPIYVAKSEQTCALGSAMAASVAAGIHKDFGTAQLAMSAGIDCTYTPRAEYATIYQSIYQKYQSLGNHLEYNHYRP